MILATRQGNREQRDMFAGSDVIPPPQSAGGQWSHSGRRVTAADAVSLPAALAAVRLLAETVGALPLNLYRKNGQQRSLAPTVSQSRLLGEKPNELSTRFDTWAYMVASLQRGNAYLFKVKDRRTGEVLELLPQNPERVEPRVEGNEIVYKVPKRDSPGQTVELTRSDIIHIPGVLWDSPYIGVSPITANHNALGTALAADEYAGRYFGNDATPAGVITTPGNTRKEQRDEIRQEWAARHRGVSASHQPAILWGGWDYKQISFSAHDSQLIESRKYSVEEVARIFRVPAVLIGGPETQPRITAEQKNQEFLIFSVGPWLSRIELGLHADDDLFPDKNLFPRFDADGLLRADTGTRYAAYVQARQAGWLSVNDIRAKENLPPIAGGDTYQQTPVGGAPNLQVDTLSGGSDVVPAGDTAT